MFYSFPGFYLLIILPVIFQKVSNERINTIDLKNRRHSNNDSIRCELPGYPTNGRWSVVGGEGVPGEIIVQNTVIVYECDPQYKLSSTPLFVCDTNWTRSNFPICEKKCLPKYSTSTTLIRCDDKYGQEIPCDEAVDGTFLSYNCSDFYEPPFSSKKIVICEGGEWNLNPVCQPVCGKKIDKDIVKLVYGGATYDKIEYPWIVGIFQRSFSDFVVCGATIVSENVILTAAHCVANDYGNALPPEEFVAAIGKYYTRYKHPKDKNIQYVDIDRIVISSGYSGSNKRYLEDIALLITKDLIIFNEQIKPICYQDLPNIRIHPRQVGVVAGWGRTETGEQPEELRTLKIPYKYGKTCAQELPKEWALLYYTNDKICSGFFNQNKSLCPGDSGSGLYFENLENGRYYIQGIVSVGHAIDGQCDPQQNSLYTKVASYYDLIIGVVTREHVEPCVLPVYPKHGRWSVPGRQKKPGDVVSATTVIHIECDQGYKLISTNASTECRSARILPRCRPLCPKPNFPKIITYKCKDYRRIQVDCSEATDGSSLVYSCPAGYKLNGTNTIVCRNGSWEGVPGCVGTIIHDGCILPSHPDNGEWELLGGKAQPGDIISFNNVLQFKCQDGYKLSTRSKYLPCDKNWKSVEIPECEKPCPPLYNSTTYTITCFNKKGRRIDCSQAMHGSYLEYNCAQFYEIPFGYTNTLLCENGNWSNIRPICHPVCGKKVKDQSNSLINNFKQAEKFEYPWVVAIYEKGYGDYTNICGGTILSVTVVLTAAHCVTDGNRNAFPANTYLVGVGKLYSHYRDPQDVHAQYLEVSEVIIHEQYKSGDNSRFLADMAFLVTKEEIELSEIIQPVCFNNIQNVKLYEGDKGELSGWGMAKGDVISEPQRTIKMTYKYESTCAEGLPPIFADAHNKIDKICAGIINQSDRLCKGGKTKCLTFENKEDGRYYVHAIVSVGPSIDRVCSIGENTLYIKLAFYYDYIQKVLMKYTPDVKDCTLPSHPENGRWVIDGQRKNPGDLVAAKTILNVECSSGFNLTSTRSKVVCDSAYNMPTCLKACPELNFNNGTFFRCINEEGLSIDCSQALEGSQLLHSCREKYPVPGNYTNTRLCRNGAWGLPLPECAPIRFIGANSANVDLNGNSTEEASASSVGPTASVEDTIQLPLSA